MRGLWVENDWGERKTVVKWGDFGPFVEGTKVRVWSNLNPIRKKSDLPFQRQDQRYTDPTPQKKSDSPHKNQTCRDYRADATA